MAYWSSATYSVGDLVMVSRRETPWNLRPSASGGQPPRKEVGRWGFGAAVLRVSRNIPTSNDDDRDGTGPIQRHNLYDVVLGDGQILRDVRQADMVGAVPAFATCAYSEDPQLLENHGPFPLAYMAPMVHTSAVFADAVASPPSTSSGEEGSGTSSDPDLGGVAGEVARRRSTGAVVRRVLRRERHLVSASGLLEYDPGGEGYVHRMYVPHGSDVRLLGPEATKRLDAVWHMEIPRSGSQGFMDTDDIVVDDDPEAPPILVFAGAIRPLHSIHFVDEADAHAAWLELPVKERLSGSRPEPTLSSFQSWDEFSDYLRRHTGLLPVRFPDSEIVDEQAGGTFGCYVAALVAGSITRWATPRGDEPCNYYDLKYFLSERFARTNARERRLTLPERKADDETRARLESELEGRGTTGMSKEDARKLARDATLTNDFMWPHLLWPYHLRAWQAQARILSADDRSALLRKGDRRAAEVREALSGYARSVSDHISPAPRFKTLAEAADLLTAGGVEDETSRAARRAKVLMDRIRIHGERRVLTFTRLQLAFRLSTPLDFVTLSAPAPEAPSERHSFVQRPTNHLGLLPSRDLSRRLSVNLPLTDFVLDQRGRYLGKEVTPTVLPVDLLHLHDNACLHEMPLDGRDLLRSDYLSVSDAVRSDERIVGLWSPGTEAEHDARIKAATWLLYQALVVHDRHATAESLSKELADLVESDAPVPWGSTAGPLGHRRAVFMSGSCYHVFMLTADQELILFASEHPIELASSHNMTPVGKPDLTAPLIVPPDPSLPPAPSVNEAAFFTLTQAAEHVALALGSGYYSWFRRIRKGDASPQLEEIVRKAKARRRAGVGSGSKPPRDPRPEAAPGTDPLAPGGQEKSKRKRVRKPREGEEPRAPALDVDMRDADPASPLSASSVPPASLDAEAEASRKGKRKAREACTVRGERSEPRTERPNVPALRVRVPTSTDRIPPLAQLAALADDDDDDEEDDLDFCDDILEQDDDGDDGDDEDEGETSESSDGAAGEGDLPSDEGRMAAKLKKQNLLVEEDRRKAAAERERRRKIREAERRSRALSSDPPGEEEVTEDEDLDLPPENPEDDRIVMDDEEEPDEEDLEGTDSEYEDIILLLVQSSKKFYNEILGAGAAGRSVDAAPPPRLEGIVADPDDLPGFSENRYLHVAKTAPDARALSVYNGSDWQVPMYRAFWMLKTYLDSHIEEGDPTTDVILLAIPWLKLLHESATMQLRCAEQLNRWLATETRLANDIRIGSPALEFADLLGKDWGAHVTEGYFVWRVAMTAWVRGGDHGVLELNVEDMAYSYFAEESASAVHHEGGAAIQRRGEEGAAKLEARAKELARLEKRRKAREEGGKESEPPTRRIRSINNVLALDDSVDRALDKYHYAHVVSVDAEAKVRRKESLRLMADTYPLYSRNNYLGNASTVIYYTLQLMEVFARHSVRAVPGRVVMDTDVPYHAEQKQHDLFRSSKISVATVYGDNVRKAKTMNMWLLKRGGVDARDLSKPHDVVERLDPTQFYNRVDFRATDYDITYQRGKQTMSRTSLPNMGGARQGDIEDPLWELLMDEIGSDLAAGLAEGSVGDDSTYSDDERTATTRLDLRRVRSALADALRPWLMVDLVLSIKEAGRAVVTSSEDSAFVVCYQLPSYFPSTEIMSIPLPSSRSLSAREMHLLAALVETAYVLVTKCTEGDDLRLNSGLDESVTGRSLAGRYETPDEKNRALSVIWPPVLSRERAPSPPDERKPVDPLESLIQTQTASLAEARSVNRAAKRSRAAGRQGAEGGASSSTRPAGRGGEQEKEDTGSESLKAAREFLERNRDEPTRTGPVSSYDPEVLEAFMEERAEDPVGPIPVPYHEDVTRAEDILPGRADPVPESARETMPEEELGYDARDLRSEWLQGLEYLKTSLPSRRPSSSSSHDGWWDLWRATEISSRHPDTAGEEGGFRLAEDEASDAGRDEPPTLSALEGFCQLPDTMDGDVSVADVSRGSETMLPSASPPAIILCSVQVLGARAWYLNPEGTLVRWPDTDLDLVLTVADFLQALSHSEDAAHATPLEPPRTPSDSLKFLVDSVRTVMRFGTSDHRRLFCVYSSSSEASPAVSVPTKASLISKFVFSTPRLSGLTNTVRQVEASAQEYREASLARADAMKRVAGSHPEPPEPEKRRRVGAVLAGASAGHRTPDLQSQIENVLKVCCATVGTRFAEKLCGGKPIEDPVRYFGGRDAPRLSAIHAMREVADRPAEIRSELAWRTAHAVSHFINAGLGRHATHVVWQDDHRRRRIKFAVQAQGHEGSHLMMALLVADRGDGGTEDACRGDGDRQRSTWDSRHAVYTSDGKVTLMNWWDLEGAMDGALCVVDSGEFASRTDVIDAAFVQACMGLSPVARTLDPLDPGYKNRRAFVLEPVDPDKDDGGEKDGGCDALAPHVPGGPSSSTAAAGDFIYMVPYPSETRDTATARRWRDSEGDSAGAGAPSRISKAVFLANAFLDPGDFSEKCFVGRDGDTAVEYFRHKRGRYPVGDADLPDMVADLLELAGQFVTGVDSQEGFVAMVRDGLTERMVVRDRDTGKLAVLIRTSDGRRWFRVAEGSEVCGVTHRVLLARIESGRCSGLVHDYGPFNFLVEHLRRSWGSRRDRISSRSLRKGHLIELVYSDLRDTFFRRSLAVASSPSPALGPAPSDRLRKEASRVAFDIKMLMDVLHRERERVMNRTDDDDDVPTVPVTVSASALSELNALVYRACASLGMEASLVFDRCPVSEGVVTVPDYLLETMSRDPPKPRLQPTVKCRPTVEKGRDYSHDHAPYSRCSSFAGSPFVTIPRLAFVSVMLH